MGTAQPTKGGPAVPPGGGSLARMVTSGGRVDLALLQRIAEAVPCEEFVRFMQKPVLAGSAIHRGTLAQRTGAREMNRTILFEPEQAGGPGSVSESLKHAVYPLLKSPHATTAPHVFALGRIDSNDFVMPDYAISRQHAVIELRRDGYLLKDCGSTNGTFLKGVRLEKKSAPLADKDVVSFARYEFAFLLPGSLYAMLRG